MEHLLKQLSAYDFVNAFVPGVVVVLGVERLGYADVFGMNIVAALTVCYVAGLVASRVGSVLVEPIALKSGFLKRAPYENYVFAERRDEKLERLSAVSNMYRSLVGGLVVIMLLALGTLVPDCAQTAVGAVVFMAVLILFLVAWRKQDGYAARRVGVWKGEEDDAC